MNKVNVICMKWGDKFSSDYVNRLYAMVDRNLSLPYQFICFTDDDSGLCSPIKTQPLPLISLPDNTPERGWRKLSVFKKGFGCLTGRTLFLDLDVVIVASIDDFFAAEGDFLIAHDKKNPAKMEGNSSVFRFEAGKYPEIFASFEKNFKTIKKEVRHEQAYLSREMNKRGKLQFWEDAWVPSFKYHCCQSWMKSYFQAPCIPHGAKVIIFHGHPTPAEAMKGISGKWYRYIRPTPWIGEYWRE